MKTITPNQIFLVSGHRMVAAAEIGKVLPDSKISEVIVVAPDEQAAYGLLEQRMPGMKCLGATSLEQFEAAVNKIRNRVGGKESETLLYVHDALQ